MSNVALLITSMALFGSSGLAIWLWFAMLSADAETRIEEDALGISAGR